MNSKCKYRGIEASIAQLEQQLAQMKTEKISLESHISKNQDRVKYDHERIRELEIQREKHTEQQKRQESRINETNARITETVELLNALEQEIIKYVDMQKIERDGAKTGHPRMRPPVSGHGRKKSEVITSPSKGNPASKTSLAASLPGMKP